MGQSTRFMVCSTSRFRSGGDRRLAIIWRMQSKQPKRPKCTQLSTMMGAQACCGGERLPCTSSNFGCLTSTLKPTDVGSRRKADSKVKNES